MRKYESVWIWPSDLSGCRTRRMSFGHWIRGPTEMYHHRVEIQIPYEAVNLQNYPLFYFPRTFSCEWTICRRLNLAPDWCIGKFEVVYRVSRSSPRHWHISEWPIKPCGRTPFQLCFNATERVSSPSCWCDFGLTRRRVFPFVVFNKRARTCAISQEMLSL